MWLNIVMWIVAGFLGLGSAYVVYQFPKKDSTDFGDFLILLVAIPGLFIGGGIFIFAPAVILGTMFGAR